MYDFVNICEANGSERTLFARCPRFLFVGSSHILEPSLLGREDMYDFVNICEANGSERTLFARCPRFLFINASHLFFFKKEKADERTRTVNLLITNQLLCQLSHIGLFIITSLQGFSFRKWDLQGSNL